MKIISLYNIFLFPLINGNIWITETLTKTVIIFIYKYLLRCFRYILTFTTLRTRKSKNKENIIGKIVNIYISLCVVYEKLMETGNMKITFLENKQLRTKNVSINGKNH